MPAPAWIQPDYTPGLSKEDWTRLLTEASLNQKTVFARLLDCGGEASCAQLAEKYGGSVQFYSTGIWMFGQKVLEISNCPAPEPSDAGPNLWLIPCQGRRTLPGEEGSYILRLRPELAAALEKDSDS